MLTASLRRSCVPLVLLVACAREARPPQAPFTEPDSIGYKTLAYASPLCTTCISARRLAVMGDTTEPGSLVDSWLRVVRDSSGNYWVSQPGFVSVFDHEGRFLRTVGRKGAGPMEFRAPLPVYVEAGGRIHVLDASRRETVLNPDFSFALQRAFPGRANDVLALPDGRYVANMWLNSSDGIGMPLHVVEGESVSQSFGKPVGEPSLVSPFSAERVLGGDTRGRILASEVYALRLDVYSGHGVRLGGVVGRPLNRARVQQGAWTDENPPASRIWAVQVDSADRLWVLEWLRRDDWREFVGPVQVPGGTTRLDMRDRATPIQSLYRCVVEVIDLQAQEVIARYEGREHFQQFAGPNGLVVGQVYSEDGTLRVGVWQLQFHPQTRRDR